jgi:hypothetical protein
MILLLGSRELHFVVVVVVVVVIIIIIIIIIYSAQFILSMNIAGVNCVREIRMQVYDTSLRQLESAVGSWKII